MLQRIFSRGRKTALRCAVVSPIGPGHSQTYRECEFSVKTAWRTAHGPFSGLEILAIDDTTGALGRSVARNQAVRRVAEAGIDWIFFLDADDLMLPDAFANVADFVEGYDAVWGLIASRAVGEADHHLRLPQILNIDRIESLFVFDPFLTLQMGHFVRTTAALATPFNRELDAGEDFDYYVRLWQHFRCVKVPRKLFVARQGERSRGPRSATAEQWGYAVRSRLAQERAQRGLVAGSPETLAIKNAAVRELQAFYREHALGDATNYLTLAREMPYRGSHRIEVWGADAFEMYSDNDDPVCLSLAWTGAYRDTTARLWHALCGPARVILDIGARTGFFGLLAARAASTECEIFCFEPLVDCYERLRLNVAANGLANVTAVRAEVGRESGQANVVTFVQEGLLSSRPQVIGDRQRVSYTQRADMVRIDDFLRGHSGQVDLVRIDVAGAELAALSGMTMVISRDHPDFLIEIASSASTREIDQLLTAHGYRHFIVDENADRLTALAQLASRSGPGSRTLWSTTRSDGDTLSIAETSGNELAWT